MEHPEKVMEELLRGRDFANQLRDLLGFEHLGHEEDLRCRREDLMAKIVESFKKTLSILMDRRGVSDERKPADSGDSVKSSAHKDGRGCYKRRKSSDSWAREHSTPNVEDGHSWRKYGQKIIQDCEHPRSYFRCTHKFDQNCQAAKQVQMIEEDPVKYRTTYFGHHTCRNLLKHARVHLESGSTGDSSILINFASDHPTPTTNNNLYSHTSPQQTSHLSSVTQGFTARSSASEYDHLTFDDLTATFEYADSVHEFDHVLDFASDHGVYECHKQE